MTDTGNLPNLAEDILRIHRAMTRGLFVAVTRGAVFLKDSFADRSLQQGFALYVQALTSVLSAHHLGEDEVAFPALKIKLPAVPYGSLAADHVRIETALNKVKNALPQIGAEAPAAALETIVENLQQILSVWTPHILIEETAFSAAAIAGAMTQAEQAELSGILAKHAQEHAGPPFFALPFVLFNLSLEERARMAALMPRTVIEELIPGEWKEKWAPMKPFLLD